MTDHAHRKHTHRVTLAFLTCVGLLYAGLGIFCAVKPDQAAETVGFTLSGGAGSSEFLTVYGGLEIGLGLTFLMPLWWRDSTQFSLAGCLLIHAALVACRSLGFALFDDTGSGTIKLAIGEWVILMVGCATWFVDWRRRPDSVGTE